MRSFIGDDDDTSPPVNQGLATSVRDGLQKPVNQEKLKELFAKYKRPENCLNLLAPRVNEEIWCEARKTSRTSDIKAQQLQGMIAKATIPIVQLMDNVMEDMVAKRELDAKTVLNKAKDSLRMLIAALSNMNSSRRQNFKPDLSLPFKKLCAPNAVVTSECLFGDELNKKIRDISEAKQITSKLSAGHSKQKTNLYGGTKNFTATRYSPYSNEGQLSRGGRRNFGGSHTVSQASRGRGQSYRGKTAQQQSFLARRQKDTYRR
ncbi:uncharacterized protein LOC124259935 [Haliotis rubra]|uniref:uncharacterized protein LOC124259935 n=1 Tax=Haliotis rubra TaxID=36100 RepID=UPI001EE62043|nr:uncharacterized protein LOC124259935 [Haliotis rubra]